MFPTFFILLFLNRVSVCTIDHEDCGNLDDDDGASDDVHDLRRGSRV